MYLCHHWCNYCLQLMLWLSLVLTCAISCIIMIFCQHIFTITVFCVCYWPLVMKDDILHVCFYIVLLVFDYSFSCPLKSIFSLLSVYDIVLWVHILSEICNEYRTVEVRLTVCILLVSLYHDISFVRLLRWLQVGSG